MSHRLTQRVRSVVARVECELSLGTCVTVRTCNTVTALVERSGAGS